MKSKMLATLAIAMMICCGTAQAQWPNNTYGNPIGWEVEVGTRLMERPGTDNAFPLVTLEPTLVTAFDGEDASDLDFSAGVDFRFLKSTDYGTAWEIRGFFNNWDNFESRFGTLSAPAFTPAALPAGSFPSTFDYLYESELFSLELNYRTSIRPGITAYIGPRFAYLNEDVVIDSTFNSPPIPPAVFQFDLESITRTTNRLPGLGIGLEFRRPLLRDLFFVGNIRGAVLANFASTRTETNGTPVVGGAAGPTVNALIFEDTATNVAGIGEVGGRLHWDIAPGTVSLYAGYEAIWLDGVGLGPTQLLESVSPPVSLNTSTTAVSHGLVFGSLIRF